VLVPLHGFLQGDTVGLLLLVHDTDTLAHVARTMIEAAAVRVAPVENVRVYRGGVELALTETVAGVGLSALERIDLVGETRRPLRGSPDLEGLPNAEMNGADLGHEGPVPEVHR
jgi:hypothetical protein